MDTHRRLEALAIASLTERACPSPELLAAYALGMLDGAQQLQVAAHVRSCPICTHDVAACRPPERRGVIVVAAPLAPTLAQGRRGDAEGSVRRFVTADILVELTISPPEGEFWRLTGMISREERGIAGRPIVMQSGRRRYRQVSDDQGFFTFDALRAGRYTLSVLDGQTTVQIQDLVLKHDST